MENKSSVGLLVITFVAILIGVIGVSIIAESITGVTKLTTATETLNLAPAIVNGTYINQTPISLGTNTLQSGFRTDYDECVVTALASITNYTGTAMTTPLLYNFTAASGTTPATITIATALNTASAGNWTGAVNSSTVTYQYCKDNYVGGWARTVSDMVPGFFAIGIMIISALIIVWIMKKENIDLGI
jgi:hypothetical protein